MMFSKAYKIASQFTAPVVVSIRYLDGSVNSSIASYVGLNSDGWAVTAAHVFDPFLLAAQHQTDVEAYHQKENLISCDESLDARKKNKKLSRLKAQSDLKKIENVSVWWGKDGTKHTEVKIFREADLALVRLSPFPFTGIEFPRFKDPGSLALGTSLCRLGFPFSKAETSFNEDTNGFKLNPDLVLFPIDGIMTRNINIINNDGQVVRFIETSSPGLRGQSGGPIFDSEGAIWGIQSQTRSFPLDIAAKVGRNGQEVQEEQFLNVGWGVHPATILEFLGEHGVTVEVID